MSHWQPYLIAIVIGLLIGIEREKAHPHQKTMGVRTFVLISLIGAIAGDAGAVWLSYFLALFSLGLILVSYFNQTRSKAAQIDRGLTTEFAAGIVFCLGYMAHQSPALSAIIGTLVAIILFSKIYLHQFTKTLKPAELKVALLLLLGGVVVINLVPDTVIDPWGIFNPRKFGYIILTLATLEFSSYVLTKIVGERRGALVAGFLGGMVSSTAVLISSARQSTKIPETWQTQLCAALMAKLAALAEVFLIVGLISHSLFLRIMWPIGVGIFIGGLSLIVLARKKYRRNAGMNLKSPLDWKGVFRLSFMLGAILAMISLAKSILGDQGTFIASFITGFFELHGVSLANATMQSQNYLTLNAASVSILLAVVASLVAKIFISWVINREVFSQILTGVFASMITGIALVAWITFD